MSGKYDRAGEPLTLTRWTQLIEDREYQRVALDEVGDVEVSTVWLGLDHNLGGTGPPLIFETMVFDRLGDGGYQDRYATEEEARAGHVRVVTALREGRDPARADTYREALGEGENG